MPTYITEYVKNLRTQESFTFEVSSGDIGRLERCKRLISSGQATHLGTMENFVTSYEFSFFPAYKKLLEIFFENGFTTELIIQILQEFGLDDSFIKKILEDDKFIKNIHPYFERISCDGERAARTLRIVYEQVRSYYSLRPQPKIHWM